MQNSLIIQSCRQYVKLRSVVRKNSKNIKTLDAISFDTLLELQDPFARPDTTFDLTGVHLITPAALVQLVAACYAAKQGTNWTPMIILDDESVRSYLARCGFVKAVQGVAQFVPEFDEDFRGGFESYRGSNPMLIEVTKIESGKGLTKLLNKVISVLCEQLNYREYDAYDTALAISEVSQNSFDHNAASGGFIAMQVYGEGKFLEIGIADYGDGLATTLKRNTKYRNIRSDVQAIQYAMKPGVSEYDDPTRGTGLYHLLRIAYKHLGTVQVRSGDAKVRYRGDRQSGWLFSVPWMQGVQIAVNLNSSQGVPKA